MMAVLALMLTLLINGLANGLPLFGRTTGDISGMFPNLFVPAGFTFSIWGVIYFLLALFVGEELFLSLRGKEGRVPPKARWFFFISCLANMGWILSWHALLLPLSMVVMVILLVSLIGLFRSLNVLRNHPKLRDKVFVLWPVSVYLGWISVATIANASALLVSMNWNGFGLAPLTWTLTMLTIGMLLAFLFLTLHRDVAYVLVFIWAYFGIYAARRGSFNPEEVIVARAAWVGCGIMALALVIYLVLSLTKKRAQEFEEEKVPS